MKVAVRYFAVLRERRGTEVESVDAPEGCTVGELYTRIFPPGPEGSLPVLYAVNEAYVPRTHALASGDEVAFIPPLGGG